MALKRIKPFNQIHNAFDVNWKTFLTKYLLMMIVLTKFLSIVHVQISQFIESLTSPVQIIMEVSDICLRNFSIVSV